MAFDAIRPVVASGHPSAAGVPCRTGRGLTEMRSAWRTLRTGRGELVPRRGELRAPLSAVADRALRQAGAVR